VTAPVPYPTSEVAVANGKNEIIHRHSRQVVWACCVRTVGVGIRITMKVNADGIPDRRFYEPIGE
jgi:hypothetical protein